MKQVSGFRSQGSGVSIFLSVLCAFVVNIPSAFSADTVAPASVTFTNTRGDVANTEISPTYFVEGTTLLMTNCVIYSGSTTSSVVQGLDGVAVELRVGDLFSSTAYTGTVQVAASGTWWKAITVPTNYTSLFLQLKVTDAATNSYIYPLRMIRKTDPM